MNRAAAGPEGFCCLLLLSATGFPARKAKTGNPWQAAAPHHPQKGGGCAAPGPQMKDSFTFFLSFALVRDERWEDLGFQIHPQSGAQAVGDGGVEATQVAGVEHIGHGAVDAGITEQPVTGGTIIVCNPASSRCW